MEGIIVRSLSGFYDVSSPGQGITVCKPRGIFRKEGLSPLVGDAVCFSQTGDKTGVIEEILPRRNSFIRPAVANIDCMVFVAANVNPVTDPFLIDRVSVIAAYSGCETILCVNKTDLDPGTHLTEIYKNTGILTIAVSAKTGAGIYDLGCAIHGKTVAFTGNSGAGKSSLLNALVPELGLKTAEVSEALGRGKHTTRHVELFPIDESTFAADTPGFAAFDLRQMPQIPPGELGGLFPEFRKYLGSCRFDDCTHRAEPGCRVVQAVKSGEIDRSRYDSYCRLYELLDSLPTY